MSSYSWTLSSRPLTTARDVLLSPARDIQIHSQTTPLSATGRAHHKSLLVCAQSDGIPKPEDLLTSLYRLFRSRGSWMDLMHDLGGVLGSCIVGHYYYSRAIDVWSR
ncbi:hypothetical protein CY34DRAFT_738521 [Suillus luteus UH-Slu-Lm8-n1]|uniref:Uncharacterized protein n=1 Tax=Suillus luteus UH-Slu-Lm8-n1 TaxID=930992 RepID=A0A0D0AM69_9AGAM|nr:hypothetical protein CY34DRAFT_738521 [Suillus luteus UH-Slu-Lm8-n1]